MSIVSDILEGKGGDVLAIDADATVYDAIERMVEANVGSLLVFEHGRLRGIVTERDYLRRVALEGRTERQTAVRDIMTTPLVYVTPDTTVEECMAIMTDQRIRHLPVLQDGRDVVGVVSIGDVVKFQTREQSAHIKLLTDYIGAG